MKIRIHFFGTTVGRILWWRMWFLIVIIIIIEGDRQLLPTTRVLRTTTSKNHKTTVFVIWLSRIETCAGAVGHGSNNNNNNRRTGNNDNNENNSSPPTHVCVRTMEEAEQYYMKHRDEKKSRTVAQTLQYVTPLMLCEDCWTYRPVSDFVSNGRYCCLWKQNENNVV